MPTSQIGKYLNRLRQCVSKGIISHQKLAYLYWFIQKWHSVLKMTSVIIVVPIVNPRPTGTPDFPSPTGGGGGGEHHVYLGSYWS